MVGTRISKRTFPFSTWLRFSPNPLKCHFTNHIYKIPFVAMCSLLACIHSGAGTFGVVYKGVDVDTEDAIALKKIKMEKEKHGFPITAIREIKILKELQHKNIVRLREIGN